MGVWLVVDEGGGKTVEAGAEGNDVVCEISAKIREIIPRKIGNYEEKIKKFSRIFSENSENAHRGFTSVTHKINDIFFQNSTLFS